MSRYSNEWSDLTEEQKNIILSHQTSFPVKVGAIAKAFGITVKRATLKPGISGHIIENDNGVMIKINRHDVKERQRFTLAHELAHYLLHRDELRNGIEDTMLYRSTLSDSLEIQANKLAADIVLPFSLIEQEMFAPDTRLEAKIERIACLAKISIPAVQIRLKHSGF